MSQKNKSKRKNPKKPKKALTPEQRRERKRRKAEFQTIFINGKQKRVRREPMIEGLPQDEFLRRNAYPVTLHQLERWDLIQESDDGPPGSSIDEDPDRDPVLWVGDTPKKRID